MPRKSRRVAAKQAELGQKKRRASKHHAGVEASLPAVRVDASVPSRGRGVFHGHGNTSGDCCSRYIGRNPGDDKAGAYRQGRRPLQRHALTILTFGLR